jgi:hypothetical protein
MPAVPAFAAPARAATVSSVIAATKQAISRQTGAHLTVTVKSDSSKNPGNIAERVDADLGVGRGEETTHEGSAIATIRLTPAYAYVSGNASGLLNIMGLTAAQAKEIGKDWLSVKAGTKQYTSLSSGLTISSTAGLLPSASGTNLSSEVVAAKKFYILEWKTAATSSAPALTTQLRIAAAGISLPDQEVTSATGISETVAVSKWGERVSEKAPPAGSTIPYTKISA